MGIQINGNTDNISAIDGGLTISDLEINQTGISTFNGGVFLPDNKQVKLGNNAASPDLRIYHNIVANTSSPANHLYANSNYIDSHGAGNLFIRTAGSVGTYIGNTDGEHAASFHANGSAVLYHDASEKFRTVADGIQLTSSNHVTQVLKAGGSTSDLQIQFKDSSGNIESAIFCASDAGDLRFKTGGTNERLRIKSGGTVAIPAQGSSNANPRFIFESAVDNNDFTFSQYEDGNGTYTLIGQNLQLTSNGNTNVLDSGHKTAGILFDGRNNGAMMFYTGGTNAYIEAFRITSDGKMGLGTHNPQRLLHLQSTGDALARITSADGYAAYLELGDVSDPDGGKIVYDSGSNLEFYTASSARLRIQSDGDIRFQNYGTLFGNTGLTISNTTSGGPQLLISRQAGNPLLLNRNSDGQIVELRRGWGAGGSIDVGVNSATYNTSSDYRLKENIVPISDGITRLKTLKPSRFNWKGDTSSTRDGFIAHEVTAVPEAITGTKDEVYSEDEPSINVKAGDPKYQGIDQSKLVPLLVAALQEAIARIEALEGS